MRLKRRYLSEWQPEQFDEIAGAALQRLYVIDVGAGLRQRLALFRPHRERGGSRVDEQDRNQHQMLTHDR